MAFDPDFADNGYVYLQYTDDSTNNQLSRFTLGDDGMTLDPESEHPILYLVQPHTAHNGNWIGFGPDGYLYYTTGDGGNQHDPGNNGQDTSTLLGSILRLDVRNDADDFPMDPDTNYGIPENNPFVDKDGRDEIWAFGVRNPWRASFDRDTGDFYIGDTSQDTWEEVNFIAADSIGGENFGWRLREGFVETPTGGVGGPKTPDMVDPVYAYFHGNGPFEGHSVIGGYVYRGPVESDDIQGQYIFSDWVTGGVWSIEVDPATRLMVDGSLRDWTAELVPDVGSLTQIAGYGEDNEGNLYFVSISGNIFKLVSLPPPGDGNGDGWVDGLDYVLWAINFGTHPGPDGDISDGDYNDDGWVDGLDYVVWADNFGAHSATTVPEPGTGGLFVAALVCGIGARRRVRFV